MRTVFRLVAPAMLAAFTLVGTAGAANAATTADDPQSGPSLPNPAEVLTGGGGVFQLQNPIELILPES